MPNPPLVNEKVPGTLRAFKAARIVDRPDRPVFRAVGMGAGYGVIDQATCVRDHQHVPPHPGCGCGFYALKRREQALGLLCNVQAPALLDVELWGAFHEYEHGYVAAVQAVRGVTLVPYCFPCFFGGEPRPRPADMLATAPGVEDGDLGPVCDQHAAEGEDAISLAHLASVLGVEVAFAADGDPIVAAMKERAGLARPKPPKPRPVRRIDDLLPGETAYVFQNALAQGPGRKLWLDPLARLVQPLPGTDVPIRLGEDGIIEVDATGLQGFDGFHHRTDADRYCLDVRWIRPRGRPLRRRVTADRAGRS